MNPDAPPLTPHDAYMGELQRTGILWRALEEVDETLEYDEWRPAFEQAVQQVEAEDKQEEERSCERLWSN